MTLFELKKVSKIFSEHGPNEFRALDRVSVSIDRGEFVAIMGASGSGKSTLMNMLGCLDRPTYGTYFFDGADMTDKSHSELVKFRRHKVGFVFQNFNLLPRQSTVANVELPLVYRGVRPKIRRSQARAALERVGLSSKLTSRPSMLSGGEQQRVALARALVNEPMAILADEPTGNLDSKSGQQVMALLVDLHAHGTTIILVTHDPKVAAMAQRIINIHDGKIAG
ncbi:MAG: ABC transporter ATP-binding protein [Patescibacteria group bacterium]|jgi:putative ABC transport system ATP-binding protein